MKTIQTALVMLIVVAAAMLGASADARFLANDPVPFDPNNPAQFNRYAYGWNDPINMVDPDGRLSCAANAACDAASFYGGIPSGFRSNVTGADRAGALTSGAAMSGLAGAAACASGGCAGAAILGGEVLAGEALGPAGAAGLGAAGLNAAGRMGALDDVGAFVADNAARINQKLGAKLGQGRLPFEASATGAAQARGAVGDTLSNPSAVSETFETSGGNMVRDVYSESTGMTVRVREDGVFDTMIEGKTDRF